MGVEGGRERPEKVKEGGIVKQRPGRAQRIMTNLGRREIFLPRPARPHLAGLAGGQFSANEGIQAYSGQKLGNLSGLKEGSSNIHGS